MRKRIAKLLAAVAVLATGAASMGCIWLVIDEPNATNLNLD
mgnify:CR=1 FL=1